MLVVVNSVTDRILKRIRTAHRQGRDHRQPGQAVLGRPGGAGADQGDRAAKRPL